jgi:hypothetical protein
MRQDKDNSAQWMIDHHGDAILRLAGVRGFNSWQALHPSLAHPRQLPDGLLEARFPGQADPVLFIVEVATYPEERMLVQAARDAALVWLDRRVVPEVITLVLRPRGQHDLTGDWRQASPLGTTRLACQWRVLPAWTLRAEDLLALDDVGVIPWVPLAQTAMPVPDLLRTCRERIEKQGRDEEQENLLAVTQVMTFLRYNDQSLLSIIGGKKMIIESPLIQEILAENLQETILKLLQAKFGPVPPEVGAKVRDIQDVERLQQVNLSAGVCTDLNAFRAQLPS